MASQQSTSRFISLIAIVLFFIGAIILFAQFIRPAYTTAQETKSEVLSRKELLDSQRTAINQVKRLIESYQGATDFAEIVAIALPERESVAEASHQLTALAGVHQLAVRNVTVGTIGARATAKTTSRSAPSGESIIQPIGSLSIQIRLSGSYAAFKDYLKNVETNIRIMDIRDVGVSPDSSGVPGLYTFDLTVVAYHQNAS